MNLLGKNTGRGFTLLELLIVVAVVAIMLTIAVPSMQSLIKSNRVIAEVDGFVGDLQFARSEAIRRGFPVVICASSDNTTCLAANNGGTTDWSVGWIVVPKNGNGPNAISGTPIRVRPPWSGNDTFTSAAASITFTQDGFAQGLFAAGGTLLNLNTTPPNNALLRCVQINQLGHQVVLTRDDGVKGCP